MIHETAIIGEAPCVYAHEDGRRPRKAVEDHGVLIGADVDIWALAMVVNGTERPTRIGARSRLLHRAHIGHDVIVGEDVIVGAGSLVAGFAEIGDRTELKVGVLVRNRVKIGRDCIIGMGAVVTRDVPDGVVAAGNPCRIIRLREDVARRDRVPVVESLESLGSLADP